MSNTIFVMPRERNLILASLLVLAGLGWLIVVRQAASMNAMGGMSMGLTMGMRIPVFVAMWTAMMAAMMFPAAAPMVLTFARISAGKRQRGQAFVPSWIFAGAYLLVWTIFGVLAYGAAAGVDWLAGQSLWWRDHSGRLAGGAVALAGLYQFTPLKHACLSKCRSLLGFIVGYWRDGYVGALAMGFRHGAYCLGCCCFLFLILFPLGVMNVTLMVLITALIFAEKSLPVGERIGHAAGLALLAYGAVMLILPRVLPTPM